MKANLQATYKSNSDVQDELVDEFAARVRRALGGKCAHIYWFGSRARGESREDSDYDLFLESSSKLTEDERNRVAAITVELSGRHNIALDVHYGTSDRLRGPNRIMTPFRDILLREGIPA